MLTSNFKTCWSNPKAVAISIGKPRGWKGRSYPALAPTRSMLKMNEADFERHYEAILSKLDPKTVFEDLGNDAILLCWEKFNDRCHRRRVAEWLESALKITIPELGHDREESLPFDLQLRPTSHAPRPRTQKGQRSMF